MIIYQLIWLQIIFSTLIPHYIQF